MWRAAPYTKRQVDIQWRFCSLIPGQGFGLPVESAHTAGEIGDIAVEHSITSQVRHEQVASPSSRSRDRLHRRAAWRLRWLAGAGSDGGSAWSAAGAVFGIGQAARDAGTLWSDRAGGGHAVEPDRPASFGPWPCALGPASWRVSGAHGRGAGLAGGGWTRGRGAATSRCSSARCGRAGGCIRAASMLPGAGASSLTAMWRCGGARTTPAAGNGAGTAR